MPNSARSGYCLSDQHRTGRLRVAVTENRGPPLIQLLVEPVEAHCSASHNTVLGLRRHSFKALHHHLGAPGEKPSGLDARGLVLRKGTLVDASLLPAAGN